MSCRMKCRLTMNLASCGFCRPKAFYNKIAKVYDLLAEHSECPMREAGSRLLAAVPGDRILDIGFGTGHILAELANAVGPTGTVFGIDISENMLAHAKDVLSNLGLIDRASLVCGDAEKLPYSDGSMDGIFTGFTLELFDTPGIPKALAQCKWVLRAGGASWPCPRKTRKGFRPDQAGPERSRNGKRHRWTE